MTNYENLAQITGDSKPIDEEAVGMLIAHIENERGISLTANADHYVSLYRKMKEWLNSQVSK